MLQFKLREKILLAFALLATITIVVTSLSLWFKANNKAEIAIEEQVNDRLLALNEIRKHQIQDYFKTLQRNIRAYSIDSLTVSMVQSLDRGFRKDAGQIKGSDEDKKNLAAYYKNAFSKYFNEKNGHDPESLELLVEKMDPVAVSFQQGYIAGNDAPFGEKHFLLDPDDGKLYNTEHATRHQQLQTFKAKLGVAEIYLVNPQGYVIYSTNKNIDFATSLKNGPFAQTALGRVFTESIAAESHEHVSLSDFTAYLPAFNEQSAFIASPIQDTLVDDAYEILGIMIFRITPESLNSIMTNDKQWDKIGLGNTGESYLTGKDNLLRSNSRAIYTSLQGKGQDLGKIVTDAKTRTIIKAQQSSIGLLNVHSIGVEKALQGETGVAIGKSYTNAEALFAYTPLQQKGLNWVIISEIDVLEAFHAKIELGNSLRNTAVLVTLIMVAVAIFIGWVFSNSITKPIMKFNKVIAQIEKNSDLRLRTEIHTRDEIGEMSEALDTMLEKFQGSLEQVGSATSQLAAASDVLKMVTDETTAGVAVQSDEIHQITSAINEMTATVQEVARSASKAAESAHDADARSEEGKRIVEQSIDSTRAMAEEIERAAEVISSLHQKSDNIGAVLVVIKDIAEQTNLLALNAAIEAARAGEQGRGFAVVADEVRTLASRTQTSTTEIEEMIARLQEGAQQAVDAISRGREKTLSNVDLAAKVGDALVAITASIAKVNEMNTMIASAAEEQSATTGHIDQNIVQINQSSSAIAGQAKQVSERCDELTLLASTLQHMVAQFKTTS
ncbi:MAG: methyl-accepting chemotaxis protein [Gammaproteobacteria bacterium]|nr:methyl-accepting chemotaxis protein [Gammaproteobacteria bacterium]MDH5653390.1 methyl-accepting chemotaxis protein [Gammaproteobacteria bacterium]